jgi:hypothetical protein
MNRSNFLVKYSTYPKALLNSPVSSSLLASAMGNSKTSPINAKEDAV